LVGIGFVSGLILGFSIAAPVGPIGILCIRRTLTRGHWSGLSTGLGAATADAFYGSIAAFGLAALASFLVDQGFWLRPLGAMLLGYLGLRAWWTRPSEEPPPTHASSLTGDYITSLGLTLTNPLTILSFAGAYAGLGLGTRVSGAANAAWMVSGVFLGSAAWWVLLTSGVSSIRSRLQPAHLLWINRISGAILLLLAILILAREWA
jgi:threonine/homoserine/homoserine lactone efflux protein